MKKALSLLLVFVVAISLFTGCKKETPKEVLEKSFKKSFDINTSESSFDMTMNIDVDGLEDPNSTFIFQMINNSKLNGIIKGDIDKMESAGELTLDMNGMSYKADFFATNEKAVFKIPLMEKYIIMDQPVSSDKTNDQKGDFKKLNMEMMDIFLNNMTDENIKALEKETLSTPEGEIEVTGYEINFSNDEIAKVIDELFSYLFESEVFKNIMKNSAKNTAALEGEEASSEEIDEMVKKMEEDMNEALENMKENLSFDSFKLVYGIDKNYNIRSSIINTALTAKIGEDEQQSISLKFDIASKVWNINKPVEINMPELNEENSVKLEELANQLPMGM